MEREPRPRNATTGRLTWGLAALLLLVHALFLLRSARSVGCLADEANYFNSGRILLRHGWAHDFTLYQGPLPLVANQLFAGSFPPGGYQRLESQDGLLFRGRLGTLPFALLAAALVFLWARQAFGDAGGLLALLVHALNPVLIAYGATLLVDVQLAALLLLALYLGWRSFETGRRALWPWIGVALGLALATKYSALLFLPPIVMGVAGSAWLRAKACEKGGARLEPGTAARIIESGSSVLVIGVCALLALRAGYGFRGGFAALSRDVYGSGLVRGFVDAPVLGHLAALLPAPFLRGVDFQLVTSERDWDIFLNGVFASGHPGYYLWTFLCKTPEVVLLLTALLVFRLPFLLRPRRRGFTSALTLVPALLCVLVYLSFFSSMQLGVRYLVPLLPPLFVLLGSLATWGWIARLSRPALLLAGLILAAALIPELVRGGPDLIAYYNKTSGGQVHAYRRFRDTNSDYSQHDRDGLAELHRLFPGTFTTLCPRSGARFGRLAVSVEELRARDPDDPRRSRFDWLTSGEPLAHLGASWWIFEVTPEMLEELVRRSNDPDVRQDLALAYLGAGQRAEAAQHLQALDDARAEPLRKLAALQEEAAKNPKKLAALVQAWTQVGRPDRAAEVVGEHPELRDSPEAIAGELLAIEERKDLAGVFEFLDRAQPGPWGPVLLRLVLKLKRGGPPEVLAVYDRIMQLAAGTTWAETWARNPLFQEVRQDMEDRRRIIALLE